MRRRAVVLSLALTSALTGTSHGEDAVDPADRVRAEIAGVRRSLEAKPLKGEMEGLAPSIGGALDASADALDAGRLYMSLEALRRAEGLTHGARFALDKEATAAATLPAFESEWSAVSRALNMKSDRRWSRSTVATRALAETAEARIGPLLEGARGFAVAKGPKEGLFYMGQARGEAAFAELCASLTFGGG